MPAWSTGCRCSTSGWRRCSIICELTPLALEPLAEEAAHERLAQIADYFQARKDTQDQAGGGAPYKPLPPDKLYLAEAEWKQWLDNKPIAKLTPFAAPEAANVIEIDAHAGHNFTAERATPNANVFEAVTKHVHGLQASGKRALIALWSEGSRERMAHVLAEHKLVNLKNVASWPDALALPRHEIALAVLGINAGFETADVALITEEDILGDRLVRARRQGKRAGQFHRRGDEPRGRRSRRPRRSRHRPLCRLARHRSRRRAARLPRNPLRRRRQAVPAGREHRAVVALRLGRRGRRARPARRRGLAVAQGADEEPHPRDGRAN